MAIVCRTGNVTRADQTETPLELPLADPLGADIATTYLEVFSGKASSLDVGIWETDPGRSRWEFTDSGEVIYVISGRMTVTEDGKDAQQIEPGDLVIFPVGWKGFWEVTEPLKKVYVIFE
ncbi:cupin domain-containing protein [Microcella alkaliphila]|uniref:(S)-ureidoglycine aminohydrolase cupin domain-containing protein n=1 Tax=Microcella alkaliphila TaxID=279828 RepID=A0A0U5BCR4_9MICO|nr:cupin domain-containing protein [Microcella alkaliphila]BAU33529.1 uncharacterized protein MalAC0309_2698 [Microcella alkaliphila]